MSGALSKHNRLLGEAAVAAKAAREIAEKAEADNGREMTADERKEFDAKFAQAVELKKQADAAKADEAVMAQAKELAELIGMPNASKDDLDAQLRDPERKQASKSLGQIVTSSAAFKSLTEPWRQSDGSLRVPEKARVQSDSINFPTLIGQKSLFVGGSQTSAGAFVTPERTDILEMLGRRVLTLRDLVSVRRTGSDTVEYVTQTSHTNAAAPVAEATSSAAPTTGASAGAALTLDPNGGYKPEGAWAFAEATATVKTIAEWVPATKRALADVAQLEGLINDELVADLKETEETQMLSGSGTGQNLLGIYNTSGIQTQAKSSDSIPDAIRKAITKARTVGRVAPSAILLNPADMEKVDLLKDTTGQYLGSGPFSGYVRTMWGVPLVESEAATAGTGLVGDFSKAVLWDREQASVTMTDSHADFFIRNLVAILAEERVAFGVTRPSAFVTVTGL
jgi:HK97 family phage major capsid protein